MTSALPNNKYGDPALMRRYESAGKRCGQLAMALGSAVLLGWAVGLVALTHIVAAWVAMPPDTALCLVLSGTSLYAAGKSRSDKHWRFVQIATAILVFGIGLATLLAYFLNPQSGIDQLFHAAAARADHGLLAGSMALASATNFTLTGAALAILDTRARLLAQLLALVAMGVSTLAVLGYAYGVDELYRVGFYSTVALHSALGILLVGSGILLVRPNHGALAVLVSTTVGGVLARRLLPLALVTPFLLGWLRIEGERRNYYESSFGVALTSLAYVILFCLFIWRSAEALRRTDGLRLDAEHVEQRKGAQMSGLIDSAMDAIVMLDDAQRIIAFNPAAETMFGYARADILGSSLSKLLPQRFRSAHGAQVDTFGVSGAASRRMGSLGSVAAIRADGTEFSAEASISTFDLGQGVCYTAIVRDISARARIESALHASERRERERSQELGNLLFAVPAAVCIAHDAQLADVTGNALHDGWFGTTDAGTPGQAVASEDVEQVQDQSRATEICSQQVALRQAAGGTEIRDYAFKHVHPDGTVRYFFGNAVPLRDEQGTPCGAISAFVDVTELKLSELAMLTVTAASVAKSDYITHLTHELRTPLNTMLGYAQMLEAGAPTPAQLTSIKQICKAGWYLNALIAEVQDLATIEADSAGLSCEPVCVDALLHDLRAMLEPLLSNAGLRMRLIGTSGLEVHANPVRIKQVMLNLLSNAIKYNCQGGSIDVSRAMDGQAQVRIGVRDTGHGLTANELASLFQPFNRLGQQHGKEVGTGVGLVVTKKLVESMGGVIGVESEVGCGSLFWFNMPVAGDAARSVKRA